MGGGKSRTMCEAIWDYALEFPGLTAVIARDKHTSIINSTKKTMVEQVIPPELLDECRTKASQGEDFIQLWNGSTIHFVGMDDPYRWYSSELSIFALDEAQEISNADSDKVVRLITRLRERCQPCIRSGNPDCAHMPHKAMLSFNPSSPGHWLQRWFLTEAERTDYGFRKENLTLEDAAAPIGDAEFVFALPKDNPYLSHAYIKPLEGLPERLRRRYMEGMWEYTEGSCFFDLDSLAYYQQLAAQTKIVCNGRLAGDIEQDFISRTRGTKPADPIKVVPGSGPLTIFKAPVKKDKDGLPKPHRYILTVDSSSGKGSDFTAIHVLDVEEFEQVAEVHAKLTPDEAAEWAYRLGRIYNDALVVCEITGGWGFAVDQKLRTLRYPKPYTRRVLDRLTKKFTDKLGFDTTTKTRPLILSALEEAIREREFGLYSMRSVAELGTFVWSEKEKPEAQAGCNDDLVLALALGVYVCLEQPKQLRRPIEKIKPVASVTGY
jgi:hypothetical protein